MATHLALLRIQKVLNVLMSRPLTHAVLGACAALALAGCAVKKPAAPPAGAASGAASVNAAGVIACQAQEASNPLIGTWYAVSTPRGMAGQMQTVTVLKPDGTMSYESQLKVGKRIRPALRETGCWTYTNGIYTMQTTRSNGEPVDIEDPIYRNRYRVERVDAQRMTLREDIKGGQSSSAKKMAPNYRLP